jgi:Rrf2 family protein
MSTVDVNRKFITHASGVDRAPLMQQELLMLSSKAKYALRALLRLVENTSAGSWIQTGEVAEQERVPRKFLEAIFVQLRDQGIIESRRGAQGGYRLVRNPASVSVADVIRILDGPLALTPCASRTRYRQCADCVDVKKCRLQPLMQEARDAVADVLENCSLSQLAGKAKADRVKAIGKRPGSKPNGGQARDRSAISLRR